MSETKDEKLPEKCCMRHEIKKGVHWIAAWNHWFTFINVALTINGIYFILARRPEPLNSSADDIDDPEIYEEKEEMWTPGRLNHPWMMTEEDKERYDEWNEDWLSWQSTSV